MLSPWNTQYTRWWLLIPGQNIFMSSLRHIFLITLTKCHRMKNSSPGLFVSHRLVLELRLCIFDVQSEQSTLTCCHLYTILKQTFHVISNISRKNWRTIKFRFTYFDVPAGLSVYYARTSPKSDSYMGEKVAKKGRNRNNPCDGAHCDTTLFAQCDGQAKCNNGANVFVGMTKVWFRERKVKQWYGCCTVTYLLVLLDS